MNTRSYKEAGVDIDAGAALVESIKPAAASTRRRGSMSDLGGFAALFDMGAAGFRDPLLVATTDGVGTKLKIAIATGCHDSIGIDLVAMCVNDIVVQGAEPLFFLDYFATGRLDVATGAAIIGGIAAGCREAGCALIGGETAEMPGMYGGADYDLAGFAVGAVERDQVLPRAGIVPGDVVLGLDSSGLHSNGFSLVRRIVAEGGFDYAGAAPFAPRQRLGQALLVPTRIYIRSCLAAARSGAVKALAHVTGGGLIENLPRVLPTDIGAELDASKWPLPPVFSWLMRTGDISRNEMARAFNCGIGMMAIVAAADAETVTRRLADAGERVRPIGRTVVRRADQPAVTIAGMEQAWPA